MTEISTPPSTIAHSQAHTRTHIGTSKRVRTEYSSQSNKHRAVLFTAEVIINHRDTTLG